MPWLGQPCRLTVPFLKPWHLDAVQLLAGLQVADLEAEQLVDVDEAQRLRAVDGERPDRRRERADLVDDLVRLRVGDEQQRRLQPGQVHPRAVEADRPCCARRSSVSIVAITFAGRGVDDVPGVLLERRHVEHLAVGRDRHAVAALRQFLLPERLLGHQIDAVERFGRGEVELASVAALATDALDVVAASSRLLAVGGDALDELVPVVDVEDQDAGAAELQVVADAGARRRRGVAKPRARPAPKPRTAPQLSRREIFGGPWLHRSGDEASAISLRRRCR